MATTTELDAKQQDVLKLVRYAAENADVASSKRDAAIREAHRTGSSLRDIAEVSGISHMTVKRILERSSD